MAYRDQDLEADIQKYLDCMEEIKVRTEILRRVLVTRTPQGEPVKNHGPRPPLSTGHYATDSEVIALQLRKILELVALSTICANRTEYDKVRGKIGKEWNARRILTAVGKVNPNFYPIPCYITQNIDTGELRIHDLEDEYLTIHDFRTLYDRCATLLHADSPYRKKDVWRNRFWTEMLVAESKLFKLLNIHRVTLGEGTRVIVVMMEDERTKRVALIEASRFHSPEHP